MQSAKVTSKGQITLPVEMRVEYGIEAGDEIVFFKGLDNKPSFYVRQMRGGPIAPIIVWQGPPVSVDQMNEDVGDAIADDYARAISRGAEDNTA